MLGQDGSLSLIDAGGRSVLLADAANGSFGFPTWSPDGSRIAAVRSSGTEASLVVFDVKAAGSELPAQAVVVFDRPSVIPFYLFWTPDGRGISFLATEADSLSLRIAPADGSTPLDGSEPGAIVRSGNPFYYDWIEQDRLLAHIGIGSDAFLGEIGLDPAAAGLALGGTPGDFRSAIVSRDRMSIAYARASGNGPGEIVVAAPDGSSEQATTVFGTAALAFDPAGDTVASIGPTEPAQAAAGFPLGPLRLVDAGSGVVRTLIDGFVVGFWWSPDGSTIAALRVQPTDASAVPAGPFPSPTQAATEVRLMFVDVATGGIRSQPTVMPGPRFVQAFLAYFDQYALSHHIWAPDSSSILLPEVGPDGTTRVTARFPDGEAPITLDGEIGFWSP